MARPIYRLDRTAAEAEEILLTFLEGTHRLANRLGVASFTVAGTVPHVTASGDLSYGKAHKAVGASDAILAMIRRTARSIEDEEAGYSEDFQRESD